jgi:hypothetical protein
MALIDLIALSAAVAVIGLRIVLLVRDTSAQPQQ